MNNPYAPIGSISHLEDTPESAELLRIRTEGFRVGDMSIVNHAERALLLYCCTTPTKGRSHDHHQ